MTVWNLTPADTIATYIALAGAGDTIHLGDGTYTQDVDFTGKNGAMGSPITIDATNDGGAVVRGQLIIENASWIDAEGIYFDNSYAGATPQYENCVVLVKDSNDINIRRVSARDTNAVGTYFNPWDMNDGNSDILLEDCASYGKGRYGYTASGSDPSSNTGITYRRCFSLWQDSNETDFFCHFSHYNGGSSLMENCVGFRASGVRALAGMLDGQGGNNTFCGNIIRECGTHCFRIGEDTNNGTWRHNVSLKNDGDGYRCIDSGTPPSNNLIDNLTVIDEDGGGNSGLYIVGIASGTTAEVQNSFLESVSGGFGFNVNPGSPNGFDNHDNRFYGMDAGDEYEGNAAAGTNEGFQNPGWNTAKYGDGAYLMASTTALAGLGESGANVGADVLYRYEDCVLTSEPLWPWPMEDRIFDEIGVSVTWEDDGGIWKTLDDVYPSPPVPFTPYCTGAGFQSRELTLVAKTPLWADNVLVSDSLRVDGLRAIWTAQGGWWSLTFNLRGRQSEVEDWIDAGLGRQIQLYSPDLMLIWDGYASKVTGNIGGLSITRGPLIESVANKVQVAYSTVDYNVTPPAVGVRDNTAWAENAASQAKYGIIERVISLAGSNPTNAAQVRDTVLGEMAEPVSDETDNIGSASETSVTVECLGWVHWLNAYTYYSAVGGSTTATAKMQLVLGADPNGIFSTDYGQITTNATVVGSWDNKYRQAYSVIKDIVSLGDAAFDRYLFGVYAGRQAKYNAVPTTPKYQRALADPGQWLELFGSGSHVEPWNVEPGEWVFYTDLLIGQSQSTTLRIDPRYLLIEQAQFSQPWALTLQGGKSARLDQLLARMGLAGSSG